MAPDIGMLLTNRPGIRPDICPFSWMDEKRSDFPMQFCVEIADHTRISVPANREVYI